MERKAYMEGSQMGESSSKPTLEKVDFFTIASMEGSQGEEEDYSLHFSFSKSLREIER